MIHLLVRPVAARQVPPPLRRRLRRWLSRALQAAGWPVAHVCLTLSDDSELHELNLQYAGEDHATDVLSFAQQEAAPPAGRPQDVTSRQLPLLLGDIVISVEMATRQAAAQGHDLDSELLHLSVHGLCHLLGYDHATLREERVMFAYEAELREEARSRRAVQLRPAPARPRSARKKANAQATPAPGQR